MNLFQLNYPTAEEGYLKELFSRNERGVAVSVGAVVLKAGDYLPPKTLDKHEVGVLISGKLEVEQTDGESILMNAGDFIFINKDEIRATKCLQDSHFIYFLFVETHTNQEQ